MDNKTNRKYLTYRKCLPREDYPKREKGKLLEDAFKTALEEIKFRFKDLTEAYNGVACFIPLGKEKPGYAPDFILPNHHAVIEVKNWNCEKYGIGLSKVKREILRRFQNFSGWKNILIITKPKWIGCAKDVLQENGVIIIELPFCITKENFQHVFRIVVGKIKYRLKRIFKIKTVKIRKISRWAINLCRQCHTRGRVCYAEYARDTPKVFVRPKGFNKVNTAFRNCGLGPPKVSATNFGIRYYNVTLVDELVSEQALFSTCPSSKVFGGPKSLRKRETTGLLG